MKATAASSQVRRTIAESDPTKNACHEKPIFTRTMSPSGDLYSLYLLIDLLSLCDFSPKPGPYCDSRSPRSTRRLRPVQSLLRQVCVASAGGDRFDRVTSVTKRSRRT